MHTRHNRKSNFSLLRNGFLSSPDSTLAYISIGALAFVTAIFLIA
jgi:hypothetical protein